jgi:hypothetical protein
MRDASPFDTIALLWQIYPMPSKRKGLFPAMPYGDRVILVLAALLFMTGQIVGALLNWFGYAWLWWL